MHAVERYGLKFANEKEAGRPVSSCSARRELRLAASDWRALHAARRGARWQISNEGLSLRPKGAAALLHRKGESLLQLKTRRGLTCRMEGSAAPGVGALSATERAAQLEMTDGGVTLRPKGAVGLLHRKGSPVRRWISKETWLMEGLSLRPKGAAALLHRKGESPLRLNARRGLTRQEEGFPLQPKGASGSAAPGVGAPSATERAAQLEMTDGGITLRPKGAVGLLHRKGSPVRRWISKETWLMEGLSLRPKGAAALLHRRGESPLRLNARRGLTRQEEGFPLQPKGASGSAAPGVGAPSATERAAQLEMTDGGITLRPKGAVGLLHRKGSPVRRWISKETWLMEGLSLRPKGAASLLHRRGESPLRLNARRGLTRRKKGSHYNRREPAALLHREWEPRPPPSVQRNSKWQTEASHCDRREPWVCCTGRGAPPDAE